MFYVSFYKNLFFVLNVNNNDKTERSSFIFLQNTIYFSLEMKKF